MMISLVQDLVIVNIKICLLNRRVKRRQNRGRDAF